MYMYVYIEKSCVVHAYIHVHICGWIWIYECVHMFMSKVNI